MSLCVSMSVCTTYVHACTCSMCPASLAAHPPARLLLPQCVGMAESAVAWRQAVADAYTASGWQGLYLGGVAFKNKKPRALLRDSKPAALRRA